jgi:DNA-binding CsgD family transcriptional regulator
VAGVFQEWVFHFFNFKSMQDGHPTCFPNPDLEQPCFPSRQDLPIRLMPHRSRADFDISKRIRRLVMGITAIPSLLSDAASAGPSSGSPAAQPPPQPTANAAGDTVQLTEAQQVYQLYNQGLQVSQIASTLSLSVAAVNSYLNLSNTGG